MTGKKHNDEPTAGMDEAIQQAMEEAEAAVEAVHSDADEERSVEIDLEPDEPEADAGGGDEPSVEEELHAARLELEVSKDRWLRAVADLENYKRRVKRDIEDAVTRSTQDLLSSFLPTVDNLERALQVAGDEAPDQLVKGIVMVRDEFLVALSKHGIEPVPSVGHPFDPAVHDALQQETSNEYGPGTVTREFEKGYRMGERLLRPARVVVAGADSTGGGEDG